MSSEFPQWQELVRSGWKSLGDTPPERVFLAAQLPLATAKTLAGGLSPADLARAQEKFLLEHWPLFLKRRATAKGWDDQHAALLVLLSFLHDGLPPGIALDAQPSKVQELYNDAQAPFERYLLTVGGKGNAARLFVDASQLQLAASASMPLPSVVEKNSNISWWAGVTFEGRSHTAAVALLALEQKSWVRLPQKRAFAATGELFSDGVLRPVDGLLEKKVAWREKFPEGLFFSSPIKEGISEQDIEPLLVRVSPKDDSAVELRDPMFAEFQGVPPLQMPDLHLGSDALAEPDFDDEPLVDVFETSVTRKSRSSRTEVDPDWVCAGSLLEAKYKLGCWCESHEGDNPRMIGWDGKPVEQYQEPRLSLGDKSVDLPFQRQGLLFQLCWAISHPKSAEPQQSMREIRQGKHQKPPRGLVIYGAPGAGKSLFSEYITQKFISGPCGLVGAALRFKARELAQHIENSNPKMLLDLLVLAGREREFVRVLEEQQRLFVVIDGLDEVGVTALHEIGRLVSRSKAFFIATARRAHSPLDSFPAHFTAEIEQLSSSEQQLLLRLWGKNDLASKIGRSSSAQISPALRSLCETPFLLSLLAGVVNDSDDLETLQVGKVYRSVLKKMIYRATSDGRFSGSMVDAVEHTTDSVLGALALDWFRSGDPYISRQALKGKLTSVGLSEVEQPRYIRALEGGSLLAPGEDQWEFPHRTFAEWWSAQALIRSSTEEQTKVLQDLLLQESEPLHSSRWQQILRFLAEEKKVSFGAILRVVLSEAQLKKNKTYHELIKHLQFVLELSVVAPLNQSSAQRIWAIFVRMFLFALPQQLLPSGDNSEVPSEPQGNLAEAMSKFIEMISRGTKNEVSSFAVVWKRFLRLIDEKLPTTPNELIDLVAQTPDQKQALADDPTILCPLCSPKSLRSFSSFLESGTPEQRFLVLIGLIGQDEVPEQDTLRGILEFLQANQFDTSAAQLTKTVLGVCLQIGYVPERHLLLPLLKEWPSYAVEELRGLALRLLPERVTELSSALESWFDTLGPDGFLRRLLASEIVSSLKEEEENFEALWQTVEKIRPWVAIALFFDDERLSGDAIERADTTPSIWIPACVQLTSFLPEWLSHVDTKALASLLWANDLNPYPPDTLRDAVGRALPLICGALWSEASLIEDALCEQSSPKEAFCLYMQKLSLEGRTDETTTSDIFSQSLQGELRAIFEERLQITQNRKLPEKHLPDAIGAMFSQEPNEEHLVKLWSSDRAKAASCLQMLRESWELLGQKKLSLLERVNRESIREWLVKAQSAAVKTLTGEESASELVSFAREVFGNDVLLVGPMPGDDPNSFQFNNGGELYNREAIDAFLLQLEKHKDQNILSELLKHPSETIATKVLGWAKIENKERLAKDVFVYHCATQRTEIWGDLSYSPDGLREPFEEPRPSPHLMRVLLDGCGLNDKALEFFANHASATARIETHRWLSKKGLPKHRELILQGLKDSDASVFRAALEAAEASHIENLLSFLLERSSWTLAHYRAILDWGLYNEKEALPGLWCSRKRAVPYLRSQEWLESLVGDLVHRVESTPNEAHGRLPELLEAWCQKIPALKETCTMSAALGLFSLDRVEIEPPEAEAGQQSADISSVFWGHFIAALSIAWRS